MDAGDYGTGSLILLPLAAALLAMGDEDSVKEAAAVLGTLQQVRCSVRHDHACHSLCVCVCVCACVWGRWGISKPHARTPETQGGVNVEIYLRTLIGGQAVRARANSHKFVCVCARARAF